MQPDDRIFVAGHQGLVGSALVRALRARGYRDVLVRARHELDLTRQDAVEAFFDEMRPAYVLLAAAKVGGILANDRFPAEFLRDNLAIQTNVIDAAYRHGSKKLLFLGSSCVYPKHAAQPMNEDALLTGPLEPTNEWYAIAKIAGLKMCQAYRRQYGFPAIAVMPTNLYGPGDNFSREGSHVLPALLRRFHDTRAAGGQSVQLWGTGTPRREFLHVDDLADACIFLMNTYDDERLLNIGWGKDVTIAELAAIIAAVTGFEGRLEFDATRPDGTPRKLLDTSRLTALGWQPKIALRAGIEQTYAWFREHQHELRT